MDVFIKYIVPILVGGFIGWFTNYLAIKMLFRPYKEIRVFGIKLPFTPGLIPKEKERIAKSLSVTISDEFLNKEILLKYLTNDDMKRKIQDSVNDIFEIIKNNHKSFKDILLDYIEEKDIDENMNILCDKVSFEIIKKIKENNLSKKIASQIIENILMDKESILGKTITFFLNDKMTFGIEKVIKDKIDEYTNNQGEKEINYILRKEINTFLISSSSLLYLNYEKEISVIKKHIVNIYEMLINKSVDKILLVVDFRKIISDRIEELDVKDLEKIIIDITKKELNAITYIGGLLGVIIGTINIFI
jgi:uncharacterized membrane protein YheB (UPF0754 family)